MSVPSSFLSGTVGAIRKSPKLNAGMQYLSIRKNEFPSELTMQLAGIAAVQESREFFVNNLNKRIRFFASSNYSSYVPPEIIIGSGFHAATYAATRVLSGFPAPLILEREPNIGGTFAMTTRPTFFLNSRNRPGSDLGFPGESGALNFLPGAPIQPDALSMSEFSTNSDMAFVILATLAQYVPPENFRLNAKVVRVESEYDDRLTVELEDGRGFRTNRVIDARGLGDPIAENTNGTTILTFLQFMKRMETVFPLRGVKRAAVIGSGDSARCAVESLLGIGPMPMMALGSLDFVENVDWYGNSLPSNRDQWLNSERGRYLRISRFLPGGSVVNAERNGQARLRVINRRASAVNVLNRPVIQQRTYDLAIVATGNELPEISNLTSSDFDPFNPDGEASIARKSYGKEVYRVGPAAQLPFSQSERQAQVSDKSANSVAIFRLANRTAQLASTLT